MKNPISMGMFPLKVDAVWRCVCPAKIVGEIIPKILAEILHRAWQWKGSTSILGGFPKWLLFSEEGREECWEGADE